MLYERCFNFVKSRLLEIKSPTWIIQFLLQYLSLLLAVKQAVWETDSISMLYLELPGQAFLFASVYHIKDETKMSSILPTTFPDAIAWNIIEFIQDCLEDIFGILYIDVSTKRRYEWGINI